MLLFTLYGVSGIAAAYLFSFLFENHSSAQNHDARQLPLWLRPRHHNVRPKIVDSTKAIAKVLVFFFRIVPAYCLGEGILALAAVLVSDQTGKKVDVWDMDQLGWDLVYMGTEAVVFTLATLLVDHPGRQLRRQQMFFDATAVPELPADEDEDVRRERREVSSAQADRQTDVVTVTNLRKVYGNGKVAGQNITFGVKRGEVFGFLGTNGAGKTTTMSVLTGEFLPSMGTCRVGGHDVVADAGLARQMMGYCPQFDALLDR